MVSSTESTREEQENLEGLVYSLIGQESIDPVLVPPMLQLSKHIYLHQSSVDRLHHVFLLKPPLDYENGFYLALNVVKGSVTTHLWNIYARTDEEYKLSLIYELDMAMSFLTSALSDGESTSLSQEKAQEVFHMKGIDLTNAKLLHGSVCWKLMHQIQTFCCIHNCGLLAFGKLLAKLILSYPLFLLNGHYVPPMPATIMFDHLFIMTSSPLIVSNHCPMLCSIFRDNDGNSVRLPNYDVFWSASGSKVLHNILNTTSNPSLLSPMRFGPHHSTESIVRLVEIFSASSFKKGEKCLYGLVEIVTISEGQGYMIHRFVTTRLNLLSKAIKMIRENKAQWAPDLPLLDAVEWRRLLDNWRQAGWIDHVNEGKVDFYNSSLWGAATILGTKRKLPSVSGKRSKALTKPLTTVVAEKEV